MEENENINLLLIEWNSWVLNKYKKKLNFIRKIWGIIFGQVISDLDPEFIKQKLFIYN